MTRVARGKVLKPDRLQAGYLQVSLCSDGIAHKRLVHRLVAIAFVSNPFDLPCVNHIDGNKSNCSGSNLEWCTHKQNTQHAHRAGLMHPARGEARSKLTEQQVRAVRAALNDREPMRKVALRFGVSLGAIAGIKRGTSWAWLT